jgi:hypothetical protein
MANCTKCGSDFQDSHCPSCGQPQSFSVKELNKQLQKYSYLLFVGLGAILAARHFYPALDENAPTILGLCLFFIPVAAHMALAVRKRLPQSFEHLRRIYLCSGTALVLVGVSLGLNGIADRAPVRLVQTTVMGKYVSSGRYTTSYHLIVPSWRPGRSTEQLNVDWEDFHSMHEGESIVVELHDGLLGLSWYSRVSPA